MPGSQVRILPGVPVHAARELDKHTRLGSASSQSSPVQPSAGPKGRRPRTRAKRTRSPVIASFSTPSVLSGATSTRRISVPLPTGSRSALTQPLRRHGLAVRLQPSRELLPVTGARFGRAVAVVVQRKRRGHVVGDPTPIQPVPGNGCSRRTFFKQLGIPVPDDYLG